VLVVRVRENPRVAGVEFVGVELVDADAVRDAVVREHLLDAGRTLNAIRAEQAIDTVQQIYRSIGVPFDVPVLLEVIPDRARHRRPRTAVRRSDCATASRRRRR
jgi:outer membrane protein assembly factor BamA